MKILVFLLFISTCLNASEFIFSKKVSRKDRETIEKDIEFFKKISFAKEFDPKTLKIFKTESADNQFFLNWLFDRVQYIFSSRELTNFDMRRRLEIHDTNFKYEFPDIFPDELLGNNYLDSRNGNVVMTNIGTALYLGGKKEKILMGIKIKTYPKGDEIEIPLSSPRAGLLKIGDNFYMNASRREIENPEQKILRISTLFHEARHSDGHAHSLGFLHSICPRGHDFEGERACDSNTNGPYSIDAYMAYEMAFNCDECDLEAKEVLKLRVLDSLSRVIVDVDDFEENFLPDAPEGKRQ